MNQEILPLRASAILITIMLFALLSLGLWDRIKTETVVVFCDVGQGDGAYIRIENRIDVVIDAGSGNKILACLGKHMPFYDKNIEFAFLSHPQKDHFGGFSVILDRYTIKTFMMSYVQSSSKSLQDLISKLSEKKAQVVFGYADFQMIFSNKSALDFIWPTESYVNKAGLDPNSYSQILLFSFSDQKILFTGDILPAEQKLFTEKLKPINILKVPHHGSRNGLTKLLLDKTRPEIAVISVGKNSYGHPSPSILKMLEENKAKIRRTDKEGDIIFRFN